jgi:hypothetical protein
MDNETTEIVKLSEEKKNKVYSAITEGKICNEIEDEINFIFEHAFEKRKRGAIWEPCLHNIFELAQISNNICDRIMKIMETGNAHERHIIICILNKTFKLNNEFTKRIIYLAIKDKYKKIQKMGLYKANQYSLYDFANFIKDESKKTNDDEVKVHFDECYNHLTKGYTIDMEDSKDGKGVYVSVYGSIMSMLPKEVLTEEEIHKYVLTKYKDADRIKDLYFKE